MQEKIFFENKKGLKLCGILSNPTGDTTKPMVVLCHGHSTSKASLTITGLEEILNKNEISTFRIDFSGHGESEGKFEETTVSDAVADILSAFEHVKSKGYLKFGLFGGSFGGAASILAAAKDPDLFILALKAPVSDYRKLETEYRGERKIKEWKEKGWAEFQLGDPRGLRLNRSFFDDFDNFNEYESAEKITAPTIIVHGNNDTDVPIEQSMKLAKIIPNCKLEIMKGANHQFTNPDDFQKMLNLLSGFIIEKTK